MTSSERRYDPQELDENIVGLKFVFEETGFEEVTLTQEPFPPHIVDWLNGGEADGVDPNAEDAQEDGLIYCRVNTKQGSFGFFMLACPMLDLKDTGVTPAELEPIAMKDAPSDFPPIVGFTCEDDQISRLLVLMMKVREKSA